MAMKITREKKKKRNTCFFLANAAGAFTPFFGAFKLKIQKKKIRNKTNINFPNHIAKLAKKN